MAMLTGIKQFKRYIDGFPAKLEELKRSKLVTINDSKTIPKDRGIYVFYESDKPVYTGRSNNLRERLQTHSRKCASHHQASFAFLRARKNFREKVPDQRSKVTSAPRSTLESDPKFKKLFVKAKEEVGKMGIRYVIVDDQIEQTLFEVYVAMALDTLEMNSFDNH